MTIQSQGIDDFARVIVIENGADNISFKSNRIIGVRSAGNSELLFSAGGTSTGTENDVLTVEKNYFENGKYGMRFIGWGAESGDNIQIKGNKFAEQYYNSISLRDIDNLLIDDNDIHLENSTSNWNWGVYLVFCENNITITGNRISMKGRSLYGILLESDDGTGTGGIIANNFIHLEPDNDSKGIGFSYWDSPVKVYHNSIHITGSYAGSSALYVTNSSNKTLTNNIAVNQAGGKVITVFSSPALSADFNDYVTTGPLFGVYGSEDIFTLDEWQTTSGMDANSVSIHPRFKSDSDLHTTYGLLDNLGTPLAEVTEDIDGEARDGTNPDMGADEFTSPDNDMAIVEFISPIDDCGLTDSENLLLTVTINGAVSQSNIPLKYSVDKGQTIIGPETLPGPVAPGDTVTFTFAAKADLSIPGRYEGMIALSDVNDSNQENDTLSFTIIHYPGINFFPFTEDFEAGDKTFSLQYETGANGETEIVDWAANNSNYGLRLGSRTSGGAFVTNLPDVWTENTDQLASAFTCSVDGSSLTDPRLKIDLRQTYFTGEGYSWFRVLVNDIQISDINGVSDFTPATPEGQWDTLYFDLSDFTGTNFTIKLQSACRSPGASTSDYGDNVFLDNIVIDDVPFVDLGSDQVVCSGETVVLDAGSGTGYTYEWKKVSSTDQLADTQTLDVTDDGEYIVVVTNSLGLFNSDTVKVTFSKPLANAGTDQEGMLWRYYHPGIPYRVVRI